MENIFEKYGNTVRVHPVEVQVNNTSGRYILPDDAILREKEVIALTVSPPIFDEENTVYFTQNSADTDRPFITPSAFLSASLTLKNGSDAIFRNVPLSTFALYPGDKNVPQIFTSRITPSNSAITIGAPTTAGRIVTGESIVLNFYYIE